MQHLSIRSNPHLLTLTPCPCSSLLAEYKAEGSSVATMAKKTTSLYHLPEVKLVANRAAAGMGKHLIASVTFADEKGGWEGRRSRPTDPQCSPVVLADKQPCKRCCCRTVCSAVRSNASPHSPSPSFPSTLQVLVLHLMRFEHLRGAALKISKAVAFDTVLRLKRPVLSDEFPPAEYRLMATVSHHGRNAAGAGCRRGGEGMRASRGGGRLHPPCGGRRLVQVLKGTCCNTCAQSEGEGQSGGLRCKFCGATCVSSSLRLVKGRALPSALT